MRKLSFIFIGIIFSSCVSTKFITLEVREPAAVSFPPEVTNVLIVDNSSSYTENEDESTKGSGILELDSARTILLNSLALFMNEENYFSKVELYPHKTNNSETSIPLSKSKIQSLCKEKRANSIISLDMFAISAQVESENTAYFTNYSILGAKLGAFINVYSAEGALYSTPIGYIDSLFRAEERDWSRRIKSNIAEVNDLITEISVVGADKLTGKFIPSWKTQDRFYYSDNSGKMKEAAQCVDAGKWAEAAEIWSDLYDTETNPKKMIRLALNLALANEAIDETENAFSWINTAFGLLPSNNRKSQLATEVTLYKEILRNRLENKPKLYEQLGLEDIEEEK